MADNTKIYEAVAARLGYDPLSVTYDCWAARHAVPSTKAALIEHIQHCHGPVLLPRDKRHTKAWLEELHQAFHQDHYLGVLMGYRSPMRVRHTHTDQTHKERRHGQNP